MPETSGVREVCSGSALIPASSTRWRGLELANREPGTGPRRRLHYGRSATRTTAETEPVAQAAVTASERPRRGRIFAARLIQYTFAPIAARTTIPGNAFTSANPIIP